MLTGTQTIHEELLRVAKSGAFVTYSDIAPLGSLNMDFLPDRNKMGDILDGISVAEHKAGRPLLAAVVIRKDKNMPGTGFFDLAKSLGLYNVGDDLGYWVEESRRVHDYWS